MSIAAAQATKFYEQVVRERVVFTFTDGGSFLVYPVGGREVVPFWSSRERLERVRREHPKYGGYLIEEIPLSSFLATTLADLSAENVAVGVNWSGSKLTGYDLPVDELIRNIEYWQKKVVRDGPAG